MESYNPSCTTSTNKAPPSGAKQGSKLHSPHNPTQLFSNSGTNAFSSYFANLREELGFSDDDDDSFRLVDDSASTHSRPFILRRKSRPDHALVSGWLEILCGDRSHSVVPHAMSNSDASSTSKRWDSDDGIPPMRPSSYSSLYVPLSPPIRHKSPNQVERKKRKVTPSQSPPRKISPKRQELAPVCPVRKLSLVDLANHSENDDDDNDDASLDPASLLSQDAPICPVRKLSLVDHSSSSSSEVEETSFEASLPAFPVLEGSNPDFPATAALLEIQSSRSPCSIMSTIHSLNLSSSFCTEESKDDPFSLPSTVSSSSLSSEESCPPSFQHNNTTIRRMLMKTHL